MGMFGDSGGYNPAKAVSDRVTRAARPQDIIPSLEKSVRPQDVVPSVKRLADPRNWPEFAEERQDKLRRWAISKGASLWMEPPVLRLVNPGSHGGDPIVYVNGINTELSEAITDASMMSLALRRPVQLLHNPTNVDELADYGFAADSVESFYDLTYVLPAPQMNHTTRQLTHLLYHTDDKISLVTHSQGCFIARNALRTMEFFGERNKIIHNLAWIAAGSPLNRNVLSLLPNRFKDLLIPGDFVGQILGRKFGKNWYHAYRRRHEFVHEKIRDTSTGRVNAANQHRHVNVIDYLAQIELEPNVATLWPSGNNPQITTQIKYGRIPIFVNHTDASIEIEYQVQFFEGREVPYWPNHSSIVTVEAKERHALGFPSPMLRARAESNGHRWDLWNTPVKLAPTEGFATSVENPTFEIAFSVQRPPNEARRPFGVEQSFIENGHRWHWFDVSSNGAYREGHPETEFFDKAMVSPASLAGTPFQSADSLHRSHYGFSRVWPKSDSVWFLPKDGTGNVWRHDPPTHWTREGRIGPYTPSSGSPFGEDDLDAFPDIVTVHQHQGWVRG